MTTDSLDNIYMRRCIDLAHLSGGFNQPNPMVGAVIVYKGKIIGEGYHQRYGEGHAEVNAVASVVDKSVLSESTIYVTLEPCFHYGKTPPCVDLILQYKIPRVVIGAVDPYHEVSGKSIEKLRELGVMVKVGVLQAEIEVLNRRFFTVVRKKRPYIILKYASSADGFMGQPDKNVRISNPLCQRLLHRWRAEEAAIMVGTNTALIDNPKLNNRLYFGRQPIRLVLDRALKIPRTHYLFDGTISTIVFTACEEKSTILGVEYVQLPFGEPNFFGALMSCLETRKIQSVLVEGGAQLIESFLDANIWDELRILRSNSCLLGEGIPAPMPKNAILKASLSLGMDSLQVLHPIDLKTP
jgi:diaminohydroxyphosphoribosylaminopyrimidine deaminase/5-amino-6-(5-phosphoribosylamino)uracil reductase